MPLTFANGANVPPVTTPAAANALIASAQATVASLGTLQGSSAQTLLPATVVVANCAAAIANGVDLNDPALDVSSPDGSLPFQEAAWLTQYAGLLSNQSFLFDAYGYVQRAADNLEVGAI